jgi:hypothetical protein
MGRASDRWRQDAADRAKAITPRAVRRALVKARLGGRSATARWRTLPDLLVIGGQRCGTSSLYKWLGRHPAVAPSLRKEIEYFTVDQARGADWYRAHFPLAARRELAGRTHRNAPGRPFLTFEATPDYLFDPRAPERVRALLPDVKLIAMLREPAGRAVSHYHHIARLGLEPLGLEEALVTEDERLAGEWARIAADIADPTGTDATWRATDLRRYSYLARGRYAEQLERWMALFPPEQLLVLRAEELFAHPEESFARILDFLGLAPWQPPEFRNYSYVNALDGDYPEPSAAVRRLLADRFAEPNDRLAKLLGDDFRWDTTTPSAAGEA